ncbi:unnamed protein product [Rotaria sp. Silwood1]|nr:unnamed protein product [Rotaria sp. Silwood1]
MITSISIDERFARQPQQARQRQRQQRQRRQQQQQQRQQPRQPQQRQRQRQQRQRQQQQRQRQKPRQPVQLVRQLQPHRLVTPSCTSPNTTGAILTISSGAATTTYALYTHGFTATDSSATLTFIITGEINGAHHYWLLDSISVNGTANSTNILVNGGYETGDFTGWTQYCATSANCDVFE